jgi:PI-3-kinase-related kinase SMG-1
VRIREAFISASVATQCHAGTIQNAALHLQDLRTLIPPSLRESRGQVLSENIHTIKGNILGDLAKVMQHISLALCRLHEADALQGLKVWVKSAFAPVLVEDYLSAPKTSTSIGPFIWLDGLTFQARGQYEKALAQYIHILQLDEALAAMGADGIQFIIARTVESYVALADWESLDQWVQELQLLRASHAGKAYCGALTTSGNDMNAVYALARFDGGDAHGALGYLDLTPQSRSELTADPWQALHRSEQMLLQVMLQRSTKRERVASELALARALVEDCSQVAMLDGLAQATPYLMQLECIQVYEAFRDIDIPEEGLNKLSLPFSPHVGWPLDHMHQNSQAWLKLLRVYRVVCPRSSRIRQLQQQLVRLARKQSNLGLSRRLLEEVLDLPVVSAGFGLDASAKQNSLSGRLLYEDILLLHAEEKQDAALVRLWQLVDDKISSCLKFPIREEIDESSNAKACLKLATWLRGSLTQSSMLIVLAKLELNVSGNETDFSLLESKEIFSNGRFKTAIEQIAGAAIKGATACSPGMAKTWFNYGYWCFAYAEGSHNPETLSSKSACNFLNLIDEEICASNSELTLEELASIRLIVSRVAAGRSSDTVNQSIPESGSDVENCVQRIAAAFMAAARFAGSEDIEGEPPSYLLAVQLQQLLQMISPAWSVAPVMPELMRIWWALRCRKVRLYSYSARGFLQYLSLSNQRLLQGALSAEVKPNREDCMLSASLYLLRIIVNYGVELEDSLQQGLLSVPPSAWQVT